MKSWLSVILITLFCGVTLYAGADFEQAKKLVAERDFEAAQKHIDVAVKEQSNNQEVLMLAGDIYAELEQPEKSLGFYERAYNENRDNSMSARKYARALSSSGKRTEAVALMRKALKNDKNDPLNELVLGQMLVEADSVNTAELILTKAREKNKKIPDAFIALGDLYYKQNVFELAKDNYEEALKLDETNLVARERLATAYYKLANRETENALANELYTRSLQQWNRITKDDPKNARAFFEQGKIYFYAKQYANAAPSLAQYARMRPDAPNVTIARWFLAQSYNEIRNCDSAEPHLLFAAEKIDSVRTKALSYVARCYFDTKKYKQSAESFAKLTSAAGVKLDADDLERYGISLMLSGDTVNAIVQIRGAIEANPRKMKTMERLANLYYDRKLYTDAIAMYRKRIESQPDTNAPRFNALIGRSYFSANMPDSATVYLNSAIEKDSSLFFARALLVNCLIALKNNAGAKDIFLAALDYAKRDPARYKGDVNRMGGAVAQTIIETKDYAELLRVAKLWIEIDKTSETALIYTAAALQGTNDKDGACKYYKEVLKLNPANEFAKKALKQLGC
ncbi:MAG: tetratricopeptide repeat protein [Candidatus Kapabacteria bacterium]|nr:tetratricopeptide repeat protein [Candidatus Kapabacteria bacterium]